VVDMKTRRGSFLGEACAFLLSFAFVHFPLITVLGRLTRKYMVHSVGYIH
jgi:hypothetical protein